MHWNGNYDAGIEFNKHESVIIIIIINNKEIFKTILHMHSSLTLA